ncbi:endonuclease I-like superfamily protein [Klebsiella phage LASTA]|uniref:Endonuclease I-like superfamily protein n=2 Tax=Lastavirus lasta TaxID=2845090 RepID=A0A6H0X3H2_9CAUD|nr:endonuclease I-like superfamily protein [Klebsiella phage LASTA]QIW86673.1 endonuclease I-like superfamily protein [Klebsiella phage LASTA]QIW86749.1 endonuclease I-like superfamily protein [Klebsiella phage SJM3]
MRFTEEEFNQLQARQAKSKIPAPKQSTSKAKLHALGRKKKGEMNATEAKFANYLRGLEITGEILWWMHEGIKLQLADNTTLNVDFNVMYADGLLVMIDVKGAKAIIEEDAKVKMKVAAEQFPFVFRYAFPRQKKDGGGWIFEEI